MHVRGFLPPPPPPPLREPTADFFSIVAIINATPTADQCMFNVKRSRGLDHACCLQRTCREGKSTGARERNSAPAVNLLRRISEFIIVEPLSIGIFGRVD